MNNGMGMDVAFEHLIPHSSEDICPPELYGNVPDPDDCESYYFCATGSATKMACGDGMEFDIGSRVRQVLRFLLAMLWSEVVVG